MTCHRHLLSSSIAGILIGLLLLHAAAAWLPAHGGAERGTPMRPVVFHDFTELRDLRDPRLHPGLDCRRTARAEPLEAAASRSARRMPPRHF